MKRIAPLAAALAATFACHVGAQTAAPAGSQATPAPSSPAKKALVAKIVSLQQPGVDNVARRMVEQPALQMLQQVGPALQQRVAADRREAVARDIQADARKFVDEMHPVAKEKAGKVAPSVLGPILEREFSEDELKQLVAIIESPVNRKYQSLGPEMQRALEEKLVAELKPTIEPKMKTLGQSVSQRLSPAPAGGAASSAGK